MLRIIPIPAFRDNYIWLLQNGKHAAVVDPGDAATVEIALQRQKLRLHAILITHHHHDHTGGVQQILHHQQATVYAPRAGQYDFPHQAVGEGDMVRLPLLGAEFRVLETPGHTLDHVVYYGADSLFCGDTLFGAGCGRLFEGSSDQMFASLQRLAKLPPATAVYPAHEYTEHNLRFARELEPDHPALIARQHKTADLRQRGLPSLPSTLAVELATNPFLRCDVPAIATAARTQTASLQTPEEVFRTIREMRNSF